MDRGGRRAWGRGRIGPGSQERRSSTGRGEYRSGERDALPCDARTSSRGTPHSPGGVGGPPFLVAKWSARWWGSEGRLLAGDADRRGPGIGGAAPLGSGAPVAGTDPAAGPSAGTL